MRSAFCRQAGEQGTVSWYAAGLLAILGGAAWPAAVPKAISLRDHGAHGAHEGAAAAAAFATDAAAAITAIWNLLRAQAERT